MNNLQIHPTAEISNKAIIGAQTIIWHNAQIREYAVIGKECILGKNVYVDHHVIIGNRVKIQNSSQIYFETIIADGVFIGPNVVLTNDIFPRAINADNSLKTQSHWKNGKTVIGKGASVGAGSIILPNISMGKFSVVGAGSVVTKHIPNYGLVYGNPAKLKCFICRCNEKIPLDMVPVDIIWKCKNCKKRLDIKSSHDLYI